MSQYTNVFDVIQSAIGTGPQKEANALTKRIAAGMFSAEKAEAALLQVARNKKRADPLAPAVTKNTHRAERLANIKDPKTLVTGGARTSATDQARKTIVETRGRAVAQPKPAAPANPAAPRGPINPDTAEQAIAFDRTPKGIGLNIKDMVTNGADDVMAMPAMQRTKEYLGGQFGTTQFTRGQVAGVGAGVAGVGGLGYALGDDDGKQLKQYR